MVAAARGLCLYTIYKNQPPADRSQVNIYDSDANSLLFLQGNSEAGGVCRVQKHLVIQYKYVQITEFSSQNLPSPMTIMLLITSSSLKITCEDKNIKAGIANLFLKYRICGHHADSSFRT